jgi:hypothetical protein
MMNDDTSPVPFFSSSLRITYSTCAECKFRNNLFACIIPKFHPPVMYSVTDLSLWRGGDKY